MLGSTRRDLLLAGAAGMSAALATGAAAAEPLAYKPLRIGLLSASIHGQPQTRNGHTWHFCQYLHPQIDYEAMRTVYPSFLEPFQRMYRNPKFSFDCLPFPGTSITQYYDADPQAAADFCKVFPGVQPAQSPEQLAKDVDAVWLGDASGYGEDHFDLIAPALTKGLPTFCDKPIGGTVAGTRKILDFAKQHGAPLMSSSLFRHEFGMEAALRMRDSGEFGKIEYVIASKNHDKAWTLHNVKFLEPFNSFILTSTGDGFRDPLEAALWVNDLLTSEKLEAAE